MINGEYIINKYDLGDSQYLFELAIDELFNSLEKQTCSSCEYWQQENPTQEARGVGMCSSYTDAKNYYATGLTQDSFGCNKWISNDT